MVNYNDVYNKLFKNPTETFIFVYTPPKVGSTTIVTSLRISLGSSVNIIHIHDDVMLNVLTGISGVSIIDFIKYISDIGKTVYIIDIYRDPIERKISEFFYKLNNLHFNVPVEKIVSYNNKLLINRFNNLFPYLSNQDYYFMLFKDDLSCFDFKKKYIFRTFDKIKYLKLRLNDVNIWGSILSCIFKQKIVIINDCITENNNMGSLYKSFKKEYKVPLNFMKQIEDDPVLLFFLSEDERKEYLCSWTHNSTYIRNAYRIDEYNLYLSVCLENQVYDKIEYDHYLDNGCFCEGCNSQRRLLFIKANKGELIKERMDHNNNVLEYKKKIDDSNLKRYHSMNRLIKSKKKNPNKVLINLNIK
jgi:hypothetical protein